MHIGRSGESVAVVVVHGKGWTVDFVDDVQQHVTDHGYEERSELEGVCLPTERMILVDSSLERAHRMEIVIHELLHAYDLSMTENRVRGISRTIARALWRLNYRQQRESCQRKDRTTTAPNSPSK